MFQVSAGVAIGSGGTLLGTQVGAANPVPALVALGLLLVFGALWALTDAAAAPEED